jgi:hypothetical protein
MGIMIYLNEGWRLSRKAEPGRFEIPTKTPSIL